MTQKWLPYMKRIKKRTRLDCVYRLESSFRVSVHMNAVCERNMRIFHLTMRTLQHMARIIRRTYVLSRLFKLIMCDGIYVVDLDAYVLFTDDYTTQEPSDMIMNVRNLINVAAYVQKWKKNQRNCTKPNLMVHTSSVSLSPLKIDYE